MSPEIVLVFGRSFYAFQVKGLGTFILLLYYTVLYYTILYCTILYYTVLYCTILYCTVLYCTILYSTLLYSTLPHPTLLHCTLLCYIIPNQLQAQNQLQESSAPGCARLQSWSRIRFTMAGCRPKLPELALHMELILDNRRTD